MKVLLTFFAIFFGFMTAAIWILFAFEFVAWQNGGGNVLLSGLGVIISAPLVLVVLFITGAVSLVFTIMFDRKIYKRLR
jgi:hypothetical protein